MKTVFLIAGLMFITSSALAQSTETMNLTTFYPSPTGNYAQVRLVPRAAGAPVVCDNAHPDSIGIMYFNPATGVPANTLMVCQNDGTGVLDWVPLGGGGLWSRNGTNLFPTNIGDSVGIGTNAPQAMLHVHGGSVGNLTAGIRLDHDLSNVSYQVLPGIPGANEAGFSIHDNTANLNRFVIDPAGNVGIGTPTPTQQLTIANGDLELVGDGRAMRFGSGNEGTIHSNGSLVLDLDTDRNQTDRTLWVQSNNANNHVLLRVQEDGRVTIGNQQRTALPASPFDYLLNLGDGLSGTNFIYFDTHDDWVLRSTTAYDLQFGSRQSLPRDFRIGYINDAGQLGTTLRVITASNSSNRKVGVTGDLNVSRDTNISNNLSVTGNATIGGSLTVGNGTITNGWPAGNYCIIQKCGQSCPNGFTATSQVTDGGSYEGPIKTSYLGNSVNCSQQAGGAFEGGNSFRLMFCCK